MSSYSKSMVSVKEYLKIDPLMLCGEIVTEVSIPVHVVTVVVQVLARIASSCHLGELFTTYGGRSHCFVAHG